MEAPKLHGTLHERPAATLIGTATQQTFWFKMVNGKTRFGCAAEKIKEYFLELATYQPVSEASFFPNHVDPSIIFEMALLSWNELKDHEIVTTPSLPTILQQSVSDEDRMIMLREILRSVIEILI
jgi:hypothetical protein